jgi:hypothetical protein
MAAALAAIVTVICLAPFQKAHAESGRRICQYIWDKGMGNPEGRNVSFVVDFKKDGDCPALDRAKITIPREVGLWMPSPDDWEKQPVPKFTCEQFQYLYKLPSSGSGGDPCTYMWASELYAVTSPKAGDTTVGPQRMFPLGNVKDLELS